MFTGCLVLVWKKCGLFTWARDNCVFLCFFLFGVPLGSASLFVCLCASTAEVRGMFSHVISRAAHPCQHAPVHSERQLYTGICLSCCPEAVMYLRVSYFSITPHNNSCNNEAFPQHYATMTVQPLLFLYPSVWGHSAFQQCNTFFYQMYFSPNSFEKNI